MGTQFFWFYDVLAAAIIVAAVFACYKRGFVAVLLGLLSIVIAFAAASILSEPISAFVYEKFIAENVSAALTENVTVIDKLEAVRSLGDLHPDKMLLGGVTMAGLDKTPDSAGKITVDLSSADFSQTGLTYDEAADLGFDTDRVSLSNMNLGRVNITAAELEKADFDRLLMAKALAGTGEQSLLEKLREILAGILPVEVSDSVMAGAVTALMIGETEADDAGTRPIAGIVSDIVIRPLFISLLKAIAFAVVFAAAMLIMSIVVRFARALRFVPLIGPVNAFLGGLAGLAEALVILLIIAEVMHIIILATGNSIVFLNTMTTEQTVLFKYIYNFNPLGLTN